MHLVILRSSRYGRRRDTRRPTLLDWFRLGWGCGFFLLVPCLVAGAAEPPRYRVVIETDAGGDPDDEQSMVRFLLYTCDWDVEAIIPNRPHARDRENLNPERTGMGIIRQMLQAYGACWENLRKHDPRFPTADFLLERTVSGCDGDEDGVERLIRIIDADDPRPVWFQNWGTDDESGVSCLKRALDQVLVERGATGYAQFKSRVRLCSDDRFGDHTARIEPPFRLWVDPKAPAMNGIRWYHRFSGLTARAGGFDLRRDVLTGHGPLGPLYPTNTTHPQKEGDTPCFLYLIPTGMNDPEQPTWGSWAGRHGRHEKFPGKPYYWANVLDTWNGATPTRDATLARWAVDLQNDFRARMDWCVEPFDKANHPPRVELVGETKRTVTAGSVVTLDVRGSRDPDAGQQIDFNWWHYREPGTYEGTVNIESADAPLARFVAPAVTEPRTIHLVATVRDNGSPPLARYARVVITVLPQRP